MYRLFICLLCILAHVCAVLSDSPASSSWIDCDINQSGAKCQCPPNFFATALAANSTAIKWQCSSIQDYDGNQYKISSGISVESVFVGTDTVFCPDNMIVTTAESDIDTRRFTLQCASVVRISAEGQEFPMLITGSNETDSRCNWVDWSQQQQQSDSEQILECPKGTFIRGAQKQSLTSFYCCPVDDNDTVSITSTEDLPDDFVEATSQLKERGGVVQIGIRGSGDRVLDLQNSTDIRLKGCHELSSDGTKSKWAVDMECLTTADQCNALIVPDRILLLPDQCGGRPARIERLSLTNGMQVIADDGFKLAKPDETVEFVVDYSNQDSFFDPRYGLSLFTRDMKGRNPHDGALHPDTLRKRGLASGEMWKAFSDWANAAVQLNVSKSQEFQVSHVFDTVTLFEAQAQAQCPLNGGSLTAQAYARCTLDFTVSADLQFGIKVVGTLLPPAVHEAYIYVRVGLETVSTFRLDAAFSAQLDLVKQLAQVTISPLQIRGVVEIGPALMLDMAINGQLNIVSSAEYTTRNRLVDWAVVIGRDAEGVMKQLTGSSSGGLSSTAKDDASLNLVGTSTQLSLLPASQLTGSVNVAASGFLRLSLRPKLALGITAVKGMFQATVGIETDAALILTLAADASAVATITSTQTQENDVIKSKELRFGANLWVDLSYQVSMMPYVQFIQKEWTTDKLPRIGTGMKSIFSKEFSASGGRSSSDRPGIQSPSAGNDGMNSVRRRSYIPNYGLLLKRDVQIVCPVSSQHKEPVHEGTTAVNSTADPCGGPRKRASIFACFCLPKIRNDPIINSQLSSSTLAESVGKLDKLESSYRCLNPLEKYPMASLLREKPPAFFVGSEAVYSGPQIAQAFATLYDKIEAFDGGQGQFGTVYKIHSIGFTKPNRVLKVFRSGQGEVAEELEVGLMVSTHLIDTKSSDSFMQVFDYFHCDINAILQQMGKTVGPGIQPGTLYTCLIMELIEGKTVKEVVYRLKHIPSSAPSVHSVTEYARSTLFQVFQAMKIGRERIKFAHLDLHVGNVMFDRELDLGSTATGSFQFMVGNMQYNVPKSATGGARIKLIDYGFSGVTINGKEILSKSRAHHLYYINGGAPHDFDAFYGTFIQQIGSSWWKKINQETDGQFDNLRDWADHWRDDPGFYAKILKTPLFAPYNPMIPTEPALPDES